jgi:hypothetical protein
MGLAGGDGECDGTHIGGAKTIRSRVGTFDVDLVSLCKNVFVGAELHA